MMWLMPQNGQQMGVKDHRGNRSGGIGLSPGSRMKRLCCGPWQIFTTSHLAFKEKQAGLWLIKNMMAMPR
jgi:hypothetical protein